MNGAPPPAALAFPVTNAGLLDLKLRLFVLHPAQDALALFQGQAEILDLRLVDVATNNENLSPHHYAIDPDKLRPNPNLD